MWSNSRVDPDRNANTFFSDDSGGDDSNSSASDSDKLEGYPRGPRSVYRNSLRLSRKWVHKGAVSNNRLLRKPQFAALATSPCGCMFAAACKGSDEVIVWLRRRNMPSQGKPWEQGARAATGMDSLSGSTTGGEGEWNFQPATVLAHPGPLAQVVWGRGPGAQQDYLLTLGEDGM